LHLKSCEEDGLDQVHRLVKKQEKGSILKGAGTVLQKKLLETVVKERHGRGLTLFQQRPVSVEVDMTFGMSVDLCAAFLLNPDQT
jgi:Fe-S cluster assembly ATPase SufC